MKALTVTIRAELQVPDDWELVEHPSGMLVLRIGDQYVDFDIAPLATRSDDPEAEWSDDDSTLVGKVLDTVAGIEVELESHALQ
ncbi:MAG: hypothetical protein FD187_1499 [bacterium]|jgi:hypothetical protein|nr:MAG: hypothetical protein FD142_264 [bacterium]KAF0148951.1 MAG: hypothetical protein FD187_1499 [bacterium]KAF0168342.1 MAG: hypothetical protein FD158_1423 [bacterium]TXT22656.1 MAG: hypothetical protein FD132_343 [bacterium]